MNDPLHLIEQATYSGMVRVRASALIFVLGLIDGALEGEADIETLVQMLTPGADKEAEQ